MLSSPGPQSSTSSFPSANLLTQSTFDLYGHLQRVVKSIKKCIQADEAWSFRIPTIIGCFSNCSLLVKTLASPMHLFGKVSNRVGEAWVRRGLKTLENSLVIVGRKDNWG